MLKTLSLTVAALSLLAACNGKPLTFSGTPVQVKRAYADSFQDKPFDTGAISVVTEEHGELHTYTLTPCGEGHVCDARQGSPRKHQITMSSRAPMQAAHSMSLLAEAV
ncbi:hypothetical protein OAC01_00970 [bacterium]|nr:hypothetical protein [bacterium]